MPLRRTLTSFVVCLSTASLSSCGESDLSGPGRVATLALTPGTARLEPGQTLQLTATVYDLAGAVLTGHALIWSTSNDAVAAVSSTGLVTALRTGSAGITASAGETSVTSRITVGFSVASVVITPEDPIISVGRSVQLKATAMASGGTVLAGPVFQWASSDLRIAPVVVGKVRGIRPGVVVVEATTEGVTGTTTVTVLGAGEPPADSNVIRY
jgi:uncharacterized protein YjdB